MSLVLFGSIPVIYGSKICEDMATGCWLWGGSLRNGYGVVTLNRRRHFVHRLLFSILVAPIPKRHQLHHQCRNPQCVNPNHLEPLSKKAHRQLHRDLRNPKPDTCSKGHPWPTKHVPGERRTCILCRNIRAKCPK